ncbi:bacteriocin biosynthesis cyclodehydratase domain-containing protein [Streptomyces sp. SLBN-118]|uniref:TOMM precursor leader peptide-binding protein n=1 Tax=Streptomyces sp. SLBN-118 TaxID=2768454 RepID=UPI00115228A9|nr:TOMM precursor leader peptide-binding protein [Streptomyces sp. SLBN-118]TQK52008.1 bacteriocin biosynthesis cyclodehydratase domain-containing protein [Streptomyces sp. SLBN-118]
MHPMVKPALKRAWRERQSVQFGVTPAHAVTVGPVDTATGTLLELFDGTRGLPLLRQEARAIGLPEGQVDALVKRLTAAGLLDDPTGGGPAAEALRKRTGAFDRLRPDLASLSVIDPEPGGGIRRLAARRAMHVHVRGAGRVGATVASLLSASGVGRVEVLDGGCAEPWDVAPGGLPAEAIGHRREAAARQLVRRTSPDRPPRATESRTAPGTGEPGLSLVVVTPRDGLAAYAPDPAGATDWIAGGTPHIYAGVVEATGVVGPLVLPGGTACASCLELDGVERDPGRARLLAQWRSGPRALPACDVALATAVAGMTAAHALSFLDGELPASTGARWEVSLPLLEWRSETFTPHLHCACGARGKSEARHTAEFGSPHETMAG